MSLGIPGPPRSRRCEAAAIRSSEENGRAFTIPTSLAAPGPPLFVPINRYSNTPGPGSVSV